MRIFPLVQRAWRSLPNRRAPAKARDGVAVLRAEALEPRCLLDGNAAVGELVSSGVAWRSALASNTLLEDDFDSENEGSPGPNFDRFLHWNVTRGCVDLIGPGWYEVYPGHGLYVDLDGSCESAGRLESKSLFTLTPGLYELQFDLGNNPDSGDVANTVKVSLGSVYREGFTVTGEQPLTRFRRLITVSEPTTGTLVFDHAGADMQGIILDRVVLSWTPRPSALSGFVYVDANNNSVRDAGEVGLAGVPVTLDGADDLGGAVARTATTAADGSYRFGDLRPGTYTLRAARPEGYLQARNTVGSAGGTPTGTDTLSDINLASGVRTTDYNFGAILPSSVSGVVGTLLLPSSMSRPAGGPHGTAQPASAGGTPRGPDTLPATLPALPVRADVPRFYGGAATLTDNDLPAQAVGVPQAIVSASVAIPQPTNHFSGKLTADIADAGGAVEPFSLAGGGAVEDTFDWRPSQLTTEQLPPSSGGPDSDVRKAYFLTAVWLVTTVAVDTLRNAVGTARDASQTERPYLA
jgi:hypothetical protein